MWNADRGALPRRRDRGRSRRPERAYTMRGYTMRGYAMRGYTMVEVAVALGMVTLMSFLVERTLTTTRDAEQQLDATRTATERGQRLAFELREMVTASRRLFQDDDVGRDYLAALDLARDPILSDARLPRADEIRVLGRDVAGDPRTGNVLFFVREADAVSAVADPASLRIRRIDTYRFVCVYPRVTSRRIVFGDGPALDLVIWRSDVFPSRAQILAIDDATERRNVISDLSRRLGHAYAWEAGAALDAAFYAIDDLGAIAATPTEDFEIGEDPLASPRGRLVYADVQLARSRTDSVARRPVFAADDPGTWAPQGFEVKIAGPSGSRKVWIHLVVEAPSGRTVAVQPNTLIASARDL